MEMIKYSAIALAIGFGLYGLWKLAEALETRKRQREEKVRWASGNVSICRYGVNSDGEITRFRSRLTEEEMAARSASVVLHSVWNLIGYWHERLSEGYRWPWRSR